MSTNLTSAIDSGTARSNQCKNMTTVRPWVLVAPCGSSVFDGKVHIKFRNHREVVESKNELSLNRLSHEYSKSTVFDGIVVYHPTEQSIYILIQETESEEPDISKLEPTEAMVQQLDCLASETRAKVVVGELFRVDEKAAFHWKSNHCAEALYQDDIDLPDVHELIEYFLRGCWLRLLAQKAVSVEDLLLAMKSSLFLTSAVPMIENSLIHVKPLDQFTTFHSDLVVHSLYLDASSDRFDIRWCYAGIIIYGLLTAEGHQPLKVDGVEVPPGTIILKNLDLLYQLKSRMASVSFKLYHCCFQSVYGFATPDNLVAEGFTVVRGKFKWHANVAVDSQHLQSSAATRKESPESHVSVSALVEKFLHRAWVTCSIRPVVEVGDLLRPRSHEHPLFSSVITAVSETSMLVTDLSATHPDFTVYNLELYDRSDKFMPYDDFAGLVVFGRLPATRFSLQRYKGLFSSNPFTTPPALVIVKKVNSAELNRIVLSGEAPLRLHEALFQWAFHSDNTPADLLAQEFSLSHGSFEWTNFWSPLTRSEQLSPIVVGAATPDTFSHASSPIPSELLTPLQLPAVGPLVESFLRSCWIRRLTPTNLSIKRIRFTERKLAEWDAIFHLDEDVPPIRRSMAAVQNLYKEIH